MNADNTTCESLEFRAEVQQLLSILANSLYTEREVFLRELVSNAADALHRVQFEMLTNRDVLDPEVELAIRLSFDEDARELTISDSGIGMTREELVENLGTIAHSGAMAFLSSLEEGQRPADIIGQFGVGFYSAFMVADELIVTTRSYLPGAQAWRWSSTGDSRFALSPAKKVSRGTEVRVKLRTDAAEFASAWRLEQVVNKHSNYVSFPVYLDDRVLNTQTALWRRPPGEVEEEEYAEFYKQLTLDPEEPLLHVHLVSDVPVDIRSALFVPRRFERDPLRFRHGYGLALYSKKVLVQDGRTDLLPDYLGFVRGVVDSEDLPLNISRESVQATKVLQHIQRALAGRVLKGLSELAQENEQDYRRFWEDFGVILKQGVPSDPSRRSELLPLLRFYSSASDGELASLDEYVARKRDDQKAIYYILAGDLASVCSSPHLDYFRDEGLEVLYLLDPLDGLVMQSISEYDGLAFSNVDDPDLDLPRREGKGQDRRKDITEDDFTQLVTRFKATLGGHVIDVRESRLLTGSPCRLVTPAGGPERDLQRVRQLMEEDYQTPPKILELNRGHQLVRDLAVLIRERPDEPVIELAIAQLLDNLLLLDGLHPNPALMVPRLQSLVEEATRIAASSARASNS
jgi:molecular chaperone HtpG